MKQWLMAERTEDVGRFYDEHYLKDGAISFTEDRTSVIDILKRFSVPYAKEGFTKSQRLLDAGCGNGQFIETMCEHVFCVGVEVSKAAFYIATDKLGGRAYIFDTPIENIPSDWIGTFDYVTCLGVLEHTMDPRKCFSKLMDCLKPGGILLVTVPLDFNDCFRYIIAERNQKTNERFASVDEWREYFGIAEEAFSIIGEGETKHVALVYEKRET